MTNREIDYLVKNLPLKVRQEIFKRLDDINPVDVRMLLERDDEYPSFRMLGYTPEGIGELLQQSSEKFQNLNDFMMENERYPIFSDSKDTFLSSTEYVEVRKKKTPDELINKFGCEWKDYVPRVYKKKQDDQRGIDD